MFFVYLLENENNKKYIGFTNNIKRRLSEHKNKKSFTTSKSKNWRLIYFEMYLDKKDALGREKFLKSGSGYKFLKRQLKNYLEP
jgi:putative endonuclease